MAEQSPNLLVSRRERQALRLIAPWVAALIVLSIVTPLVLKSASARTLVVGIVWGVVSVAAPRQVRVGCRRAVRRRQMSPSAPWLKDGDKRPTRSLDLAGVELRGARLAGADLTLADLAKARLEGADLSGTRLERALLAGARLDGAVLRRARMQHAELTDAHLERADLADAIMNNAKPDGGSPRWGDPPWRQSCRG